MRNRDTDSGSGPDSPWLWHAVSECSCVSDWLDQDDVDTKPAAVSIIRLIGCYNGRIYRRCLRCRWKRWTVSTTFSTSVPRFFWRMERTLKTSRISSVNSRWTFVRHFCAIKHLQTVRYVFPRLLCVIVLVRRLKQFTHRCDSTASSNPNGLCYPQQIEPFTNILTVNL